MPETSTTINEVTESLPGEIERYIETLVEVEIETAINEAATDLFVGNIIEEERAAENSNEHLEEEKTEGWFSLKNIYRKIWTF